MLRVLYYFTENPMKENSKSKLIRNCNCLFSSLLTWITEHAEKRTLFDTANAFIANRLSDSTVREGNSKISTAKKCCIMLYVQKKCKLITVLTQVNSSA